jgi:hypothetical protein
VGAVGGPREVDEGCLVSWSKTFTGDTRRRQVVALQRALGCSRALAVGWDAMVRDLATEHDGDLTGWADEDLEAAVLWDGAPGELAAALRTSGVLVEGDGAVRPDSWAERQGSVHERDRKRSWRSSRRGGRDGDGTVPGPSRDTDGTVPGLSQPPSPPLLSTPRGCRSARRRRRWSRRSGRSRCSRSRS